MSRDLRPPLYLDLARMMDAGVPPDTTVQTLRAHHRRPGAQVLLQSIERAWSHGEPTSAALRATGAPIVPPYHALTLEAAERSGDAPAELRRLAQDLEAEAAAQREAARRAAYPLLLFHLAVLAGSAPLLLQHPMQQTLIMLALVLPVDGLLLMAWRELRPGHSSPTRSPLAAASPAFHRIVLDGAYAVLFRCLHRLYEAGVPLAEAAAQSAQCADDSQLSHRFSTAFSPLADGRPLAECLPSLPRLRPEIAATLAVAEPAGELGQALAAAARLSSEHASEGRARFVRRAGTILYAGAVVYVAWRVVSFWASYLGALGAL